VAYNTKEKELEYRRKRREQIRNDPELRARYAAYVRKYRHTLKGKATIHKYRQTSPLYKEQVRRRATYPNGIAKRQRAYQSEAGREKSRRSSALWKQRHPKEHKIRNREYYITNRERILAQKREYNLLHMEERRAKERERYWICRQNPQPTC